MATLLDVIPPAVASDPLLPPPAQQTPIILTLWREGRTLRVSFFAGTSLEDRHRITTALATATFGVPAYLAAIRSIFSRAIIHNHTTPEVS